MIKTGFGNHVSASVTRANVMRESVGFGNHAIVVKPADQFFKLRGHYTVTHRRGGKIIDVYEVDNGIVNVGKDNLLGVMFNDAVQTPIWYIGLINSGALEAPTDTMSSHPGWTEAIGYSEGTRITWPEDAPAGQSITNTTSADFSINVTTTLYGIFLTSSSTKGGTTGILWSTGAFTLPVPVTSGDTLEITYTLNTL